MFKKPVSDWKTSAPLKNSDRRKLRTRILNAFSAYDTTLESVLDTLVPDPVFQVKFATHVNIPGVAYLDKGGEPRWLTVGKGSEELVPTVYTLWKRPELLPFLSTPAAVIPVISGGADLMIPGVVQCPSGLPAQTLVSITQYHGVGKRGPPLAVGHLAVSSREIIADDAKGKAVLLIHSWKDHLWTKGTDGEVPPPVELVEVPAKADPETPAQAELPADGHDPLPAADDNEANEENDAEESREPDFSPEEITDILRTSLLQAIVTTLSDLPQGSFPMPSTIFYTQYLLPSRPASAVDANPPVDIKHSTHKSLTAFLKAADKDGLIKLKSTPKSADVLITSVTKTHPDVQSHQKYGTAGDVEAKREKKEKQAKIALENAEKKSKQLVVHQLWKPHGSSLPWFKAEFQKGERSLFTAQELKELLNDYIARKGAINEQDRRYLNVSAFDEQLTTLVLATSTPKSVKNRVVKNENGEVEFITREDVLQILQKSMEEHYSIAHGADETPTVHKGALQPISIEEKSRGGNKMYTFIVGYEPFGIDTEMMAEELRKACSSSTGTTQLPGKGAGMRVQVQGRQTIGVKAWLIDHGIPTAWISNPAAAEKPKKGSGRK